MDLSKMITKKKISKEGEPVAKGKKTKPTGLRGLTRGPPQVIPIQMECGFEKVGAVKPMCFSLTIDPGYSWSKTDCQKLNSEQEMRVARVSVLDGELYKWKNGKEVSILRGPRDIFDVGPDYDAKTEHENGEWKLANEGPIQCHATILGLPMPANPTGSNNNNHSGKENDCPSLLVKNKSKSAEEEEPINFGENEGTTGAKVLLQSNTNRLPPFVKNHKGREIYPVVAVQTEAGVWSAHLKIPAGCSWGKDDCLGVNQDHNVTITALHVLEECNIPVYQNEELAKTLNGRFHTMFAIPSNTDESDWYLNNGYNNYKRPYYDPMDKVRVLLVGVPNNNSPGTGTQFKDPSNSNMENNNTADNPAPSTITSNDTGIRIKAEKPANAGATAGIRIKSEPSASTENNNGKEKVYDGNNPVPPNKRIKSEF